jgi:ABC-type uncharacterized transport system auxiliary subunit
MRFTISICLIAAFGMSGTSCIDSRPIHYYTIEPPSVPVGPGAPAGLVLLVGNITEPAGLQDGRIQYRTGSNEVGEYHYHRWSERPGTMVGLSLLRTLRASGKYREVLESSSSATGDYVLHGKLFEFGEVDRETVQTRISLRVELVEVKTKRVVWDDVVERDEPVSNKNVKDVVQSLDRNLQAVVSETAGKVDRFLAGNR